MQLTLARKPTEIQGCDRPLDALLARLPDAKRFGEGYRARCPGHGSRGNTLAIREGRDGAVLLRCHAGCNVSDVLHAVGLELRDLFRNGRDLAVQRAQQNADRQRYRRTGPVAVRDMLRRELTRIAEHLETKRGYPSPLKSADVNVARKRVSRILGIDLAPIAPFPWEGASPHSDDVAWPALYGRAMDEVRFSGHHPSNDVEARIAAENLAAQWLRSLSKEGDA